MPEYVIVCKKSRILPNRRLIPRNKKKSLPRNLFEFTAKTKTPKDTT
jgi:hypothetical protein